jgi:N utilization substance protein B
LYGIHLTKNEAEESLESFWEMTPAKPGVQKYAEQVIRGVCENVESLDEQISDALDNWSPDRVGHIERAVLRIALYEIIHVEDVPAPVAINEAIEVVKRFGADDAPRFVNGVLDRLRKKIDQAKAS